MAVSELATTQTAVQSSENPSNYADSVTFTANVTPAVSTSFVPTGTVTFYDAGTPIDTETLADGSASFTTSAFAAGTHAIVVQYSGDMNFSGSNSTDLAQVVKQVGSTTAVAPSTNPSVFGQSETFTATVASAARDAGTPTGQVTFYDGNTAIDTETLSGGTASYTTSSLEAAGHSITAQYSGDNNFTGSKSKAFIQTVNPASTATSAAPSLNPTVHGQSVSFTATVAAVSPGSGTPTGQVVFYDGSTPIDTESLSGGTAVYTTSALAVSGHSITAQYLGSTDFAAGTSTAFTQTVNRDGTGTAISTSLNPAVLGQAVSFQATVTAAAPGSGTPGGTVTFYDGATAVDTETLVNGSATFTTSALSLGGHAISAQYGSDTNFTSSTSATINETIKQGSATTTIGSSVNPSVFGQTVTFTASVSATPPAAGMPTGHVIFFDGNTPIDTGTLVNGAASYTTSSLAIGGHTITAQYGGDNNFTGSTSTAVVQTVNQASTSTSAAPSLNPTVHGQSVSFTATVAAVSPGSGTPTGQVVFYDGSTPIDTESLSGGTAVYTTSALAVSGHSITAMYLGSTDFAASTSTAFTQTVNRDGTGTAISTSLNPAVLGQAVSFQATVTAAAPGSGKPSGTVTFYDGATAVDTETLVNGSATFTTSALSLGGHAISAQYGSDSNFTSSTSATINETIKQGSATTTVGSSVNPSVFGQTVTFTASVSATPPAAGTPAGQVIFFDGNTPIDTETLVNGAASYTTSGLAIGSHSITAHYGGDSNFTGSTSTAFIDTVNQASTAASAAPSVNPTVHGQSLSFTATVATVSPGSGTPTGKVVFYDGNTPIDTESLSGGTAEYTTSALSVSGHFITAQYLGSTDFAASTSTAFTQTVNQDGTGTALSTSLNPAVLGQSVSFQATVTAAAPGSGTPGGTVTFYDGVTAVDTETLVNGSATFTTSSLALGGHAISAQYGSDTSFTSSTSATINETIKQGSATTTVGSSVNPTVFGQSVTFTATVSATPPATGTPTGEVVFYDGNTPIDTETIVNGAASYTTSGLAIGGHSITAQYGGDNNFTGSTSTAFTQTVNQDGTTTAVASSLNPSNLGTFVTFTATVTASAPGSGVPGGQLTFYDGTTPIDTETLSGGTASFKTSALEAGDHSITAQYGGSTDFAASTSTAITQTVKSLPTATLDGEVYNDYAEDGTIGAGSGLAGWTVDLMNGTTTAASTTTASDGSYVFTGVAPGSYTISDVLQAGYVQTAPASGFLSIIASGGAQFSGENFGVFKAVSLAVTGLTTSPPNGLMSGTNLVVEWSDTNTGTLPAAGSFTDLVTITNSTTDQVLASASVPYNATTLGNLAAGASAPMQYAFRIPDYTPGVGQILFTVTTDVNNQVSTPQGDPARTAMVAENSTLAPYPDLQVTNIAVSPASGIQSGAPVTLSWDDQNTGTGATRGSWYDSVIVTNSTTGEVIDTAVVPYNDQSSGNGPIAPGEFRVQQFALTLPDGARGAGQIQYSVTTDIYNQIAEFNTSGPGGSSTAESNNNSSLTVSSALAPYPDLVIPTLTLSPSSGLESGSDLSIQWSDSNTGTAPVNSPFVDHVVVLNTTTGAVLTTQDVAYNPTASGNGPIDAGQSRARQLSFALPQGTPGAGQIQVTVTTDYYNQVFEWNQAGPGGTSTAESNNSASTSVTAALAPYADLAASAVSAPSLTVGDPAQVTVSWTVTNQGTGPGDVGSWVDAVIASPDDNPADGTTIAVFPHQGSLAVGASYSQTQTFLLPPHFEGSYHLFVQTNATNTVFENGNTGNDIAQAPNLFDVTPIPYADLVVSSVTVPATGASGQPISVSWTVANQGIGVTNTSAWSDDVSLATDPAGSNVVLDLGLIDHYGAIAPGGGYTHTVTPSLPNGLQGTFYVVVHTGYPAVATDVGTPYEFIYTDNNTSVGGPVDVSLTPAPDLTPTQLNGPATAAAGASVDVSWNVQNLGPGDADTPWTDTLLLTPQVAGAKPYNLGTFTYTQPLQAGKSYTRDELIRLPADVQGVFQLSVTTATGLYEGGATGNDTYADPSLVTLTLPPNPDLQVSSVTSPPSANAGGPVSVEFTVVNQGSVATATPHWTDSVYLSAKPTLDSTATLLGSFANQSALQPQGTYQTTTGDMIIPDRFSGPAYLIVDTDSGNAVDETPNEGNNTDSVPITVNPLPAADLVTGDVAAPDQAYDGSTITVSYTVTNKGLNTTNVSNWNDTIWLAHDPKRPGTSKGDVLLATIPHSARWATIPAC